MDLKPIGEMMYFYFEHFHFYSPLYYKLFDSGILNLKKLVLSLFFPSCVPSCASFCGFSRLLNDAKLMLHLQSLEPNGFSPVCVFSWVLRLPEDAKQILHIVQLNGFSPVCVFLCVPKLLRVAKVMLQFVQAYRFSPLCHSS